MDSDSIPWYFLFLLFRFASFGRITKVIVEVTTVWKRDEWRRQWLTLTSYHFSIAPNLKCNGDASIYMEKHDVLMWLWTLWMCRTIVLMLESRKMEYRLHDWPRTGIRLNRNRCCERNEIDIWVSIQSTVSMETQCTFTCDYWFHF